MTHQLFTIIIACIVIGALAGLISGIFGGGSGLIMVPGFYYVSHYFPIDSSYYMQMAIATGAVTSVFLGIISTRVQWRRRQIDFDVFKKLFPGMTVGTILAILLLNVIPSAALKKLFGFLVVAVSIWFILYQQEKDTKLWSLSARINHLWSTLIALCWFLLGTAVFTAPYLHKCGLDLRRAIGTATLNTAVFSAVAGILLMCSGYLQIGASSYNVGFLNLPLMLSATIPSCIAAHWGSKLSLILPKRALKITYATLIFVIGVLMLI